MTTWSYWGQKCLKTNYFKNVCLLCWWEPAECVWERTVKGPVAVACLTQPRPRPRGVPRPAQPLAPPPRRAPPSPGPAPRSHTAETHVGPLCLGRRLLRRGSWLRVSISIFHKIWPLNADINISWIHKNIKKGLSYFNHHSACFLKAGMKTRPWP